MRGIQVSVSCENSEKFTNILSKISSKLINIELDTEYLIEDCLEEIGKGSNSSRAYIFLFRENLKYMDNIYEWCDKGVSSEKNNLKNLKTEMFPWWMKNLKNNESIIIENIDNMPKEAEVEKEILLEQGIKSLIVLPLFYRHKLIGYAGLDDIFENKNWGNEIHSFLKLISETFATALSCLQHERKLKYMNDELSRKEENINNLKAQIDKQKKFLKLSQTKELSKLIGINKENFNDILKDVMHTLSLDLKVFDEIQLNCSENSPSISCNKVEISQVIMSILKNAIYEINKKTILLKEKQNIYPNILKIETYEKNDYLICEISDNGMGFTAENKLRLFEPFFTTKGLGSGTGLGLALAYDIVVNKHNGDIIADNSEWQGAKFTIKLPIK
jgi:two-component system NtrC family sensor kinase